MNNTRTRGCGFVLVAVVALAMALSGCATSGDCKMVRMGTGSVTVIGDAKTTALMLDISMMEAECVRQDIRVLSRSEYEDRVRSILKKHHADSVTIRYDDGTIRDITAEVIGPARAGHASPFSLKIVGELDTSRAGFDFCVKGPYAYVADGSNGLSVVDISIPSEPKFTGSLKTPGDAKVIYVCGNHAYVSLFRKGIAVVDISNPLHPALTASLEGNALDIFVLGKYAYVVHGEDGLSVIDVINPTRPKVVGTLNTPGMAQDVCVSGDYAYVADFDGLQIVNVQTQSQPKIVGSINAGSHPYGKELWQRICVSGSCAYIVGAGTGLVIVDIRNPHNPQRIGAWPCSETENFEDVSVSGNYAYLAGYSGIRVIDISHPASLKQIAFLSHQDNRRIALSGTHAYVTSLMGNLKVIEIQHPVP